MSAPLLGRCPEPYERLDYTLSPVTTDTVTLLHLDGRAHHHAIAETTQGSIVKRMLDANAADHVPARPTTSCLTTEGPFLPRANRPPRNDISHLPNIRETICSSRL